jgi:chemotaxis protein methyltransferase CheR
MNAVQADKNGIEEKNLVNMLTTNHTFFMREFEQMEYFRKMVLPDLRRAEENTRDLRIWCGASSSGEEPYTIAMVLMDFFGYAHAQWDTKVLATDISTKMLTHAVKGVYSNDQLINLPDTWKSRYFKPVGETQCMATDTLKNQVIYRYLNLMNPLPFRKKLHMVFLRNVMIYFEDKTKIDLLQRIYESMEPGAYLFIGATEVIDKSQTKLQYIKPSIYRK